jgi:hypothetical protein
MDSLTNRPTILQRPRLTQPGPPAMHADVGEIQDPTRARVRPPVPDRPVDQPQQLELSLDAHARSDRAEKPERCLPRCNVNSIAISLIASDSRSFSARSSSSSTCSIDAGRPRFADANTANVASLANAPSRMITLTSTPYFRAASACEISCKVTPKKISHFSSGDSYQRLRGLPFSTITSSRFKAAQTSQH